MAKANRRKTAERSGIATETARATPVKMHDVGCVYISYRFKVALEKLDLDALRKSMGVDNTVKRGFAVCNTRDSTTDYHAHCDWRLREKSKEITIDIQYVDDPIGPKPQEQEPFADNLMQWIGQFFKHGDANAKVHSDFKFEAKKTTLSWFPLPLRTKVANLDGEAILDGISVALPSQPDLVSRFFLSHVKDSVFVGIESSRRIKFAEFSLDKELRGERAFSDKLIEVKS